MPRLECQVWKDAEWAADSPLPWDCFAGKRILITGANGLVGSCIVRALLTRRQKYGDDISIIAQVREKDKANSLLHETECDLDIFVSDLYEAIQISGPIDHIIHTASPSHPAVFVSDPVGVLESHSAMIGNLCKLAVDKHAKLTYVSSIEAYGDVEGTPMPINEEVHGGFDTDGSRACYPIGKIYCETACETYHAQFDMDYTIARLCYLFGAGISETDSKASSAFLRAAARGKDIVMQGGGLQTRSFLYVSDAAEALLTLAAKGGPRRYNVASMDNIISIKGLADMIACVSGKIKISAAPDNMHNGQMHSKPVDMILDPGRINALGWYARVNLKNGIKRAINYISEQNENN